MVRGKGIISITLYPAHTKLTGMERMKAKENDPDYLSISPKRAIVIKREES